MTDGQQQVPSAASAVLASALGALHLQAKKPGSRAIARELGNVSHTTVADALSLDPPTRFPTMPAIK